MAWSGGTFTRANPTWTTDASLGIGIEAGRHDAQDNDFTTGINQCLNKDGSNSATGNLNLGGFLPTNIGAGTAAAPAICAGNDVNTGIFSAAADEIGIATNGGERIRIDSQGRVGINASTIASTTNVQISTNNTNMIIGKFSADNAGVNCIFTKSRNATLNANTAVISGDGIGAIVFQGSGASSYGSAANISGIVDGAPSGSDIPGALIFATSPGSIGGTVERVRIDKSGNVGFGGATRSSAIKLDVKGRAALGSGNSDAEILWTRPSTADQTAWVAAVRLDVGGSNEDFKIMRFLSNAFVDIPFQIQSTTGCIGISTLPDSNTRVLINGTGTTSATTALNVRDSANTNMFYVRNDGLINTGLKSASPYNNTLGVGANVYLDNYGTLIRATSSIKYKTEIRNYDKGLAELLGLRPVYYKDKKSPSFEYAGLLAEEVHAAGMTEFVQYASPDDPDGLSYGHMIALATNAIKDLNTKVEALEARIAALEA